ncbi:DNA mismatch repair protein MLH1, partial [Phenoliferia sp. Uapishka_3]
MDTSLSINRLQIIQRPSNALKELIENALDAGATSIRVTVKDGGTKLLQIQDNGSGIRKSDLPILCERFTTSKIRAFDDLSSLSSYGFRGEALASISHVAHLAVTTKTREESCAWKAAYSDGVMIPIKSGGDAQPVPSAGNDGTLIVVEDLFFNTPTRLKSLRSSSEEYAKIVAVLLAYSIHNAGVAMVCKKSGSANSEVQTAVGASVLDNLGVHYGESVRRELVEVEAEEKKLGMKAKGWFSGANYVGKKGTFLFFINHRLVDCTPLKRAFEAFYATLLPKGAHPFVYLSLEIIPSKVDVNVHPTKREVGFEDAEEVVEVICEALAKTLEKDGGSRTFKVQTLLPSTNSKPKPDSPSLSRTQSRTKSSDGASSSTPMVSTSRSTSSTSRKVAPKSMVRTDQHAQTLDAFLTQTKTSIDDEERPTKRRKSDHDPDFANQLAKEAAIGPRVKIGQSECMLKSVKELRKEAIGRCHAELDTIVKNHIFVGVADVAGSLSMLQHQTKLYLVNHASLSEELFYQLGLRQFGRFVRIKLKPSPPLKDLVRLAVEHEDARESIQIPAEEIVERIHQTLMSSRAMLEEYFSFRINEAGEIESLPLLLQGCTPNLNKLPLFLVRIGVQVDWEDEKNCFETFLRELAFFYTPTLAPYASKEEDVDRDAVAARQIQHVIFPAAKQYLLPPEKLLKRDFVQVTSLESLYKVFERC